MSFGFYDRSEKEWPDFLSSPYKIQDYQRESYVDWINVYVQTIYDNLETRKVVLSYLKMFYMQFINILEQTLNNMKKKMMNDI